MSLPQLVVREVLKGSLGKSVVINNCGSPPCHDYQRLPASPVKPDGIIPPRLEFILELLDWNASQEPYNVTVMFFSSDNLVYKNITQSQVRAVRKLEPHGGLDLDQVLGNNEGHSLEHIKAALKVFLAVETKNGRLLGRQRRQSA
ncbi:hypothetical protein J6590_073560 [Homalodisca vitripennis]|nr:hypothetical protein J6590_073560 [Homalodisca vitripennis]